LNSLYTRKRQRLVPAIQQAVRESNEAPPDVLLSPTKSAGPSFSSWGQIFDLPRAFERDGSCESLVSVSENLTCWSSGQLNIRHASDLVLRETALLALSSKDVARLLQNRANWGGHGIEELLADLGLKGKEHSSARRLLGTDSQHFSLWITASNQSRSWSYQYVQAGKPITFAW
jgi:hypothetical protein